MSVLKPVVVVGSINIDLVATSPRIPSVGETIMGTGFQTHPGGKGANQAVAVGRLGYPVRMIGRVGSDAFGSQLIASLKGAGVDCAAVAQSEGSTGVAVILVSEAGENCIVVAPGANAEVSHTDIDANLATIREAGIVLAQLEIPIDTVEHLAEVCAREKVPLMLDPAPARHLSARILENVSWLTPNESEAEFYTNSELGEGLSSSCKDSARRLLARGCKGLVLKMGSRGAYLASSEYDGQIISAFEVNAVDTTAAGDAFNGAFATGLMLGKSPLESARLASAAAAISVTRAGAQPSMPTMDAVQEFLRSNVVQEKTAKGRA